MQHVPVFGYPTPPVSPSYEQRCYLQTSPFPAPQPCQARYVPVAPEARLGRFLTGSLRLTAILGTGAYGVVYAALDVKTNVQYAVKCLSKFNPDGTPLDPRQVEFQTCEIRLHYLASAHPNVVSMHKIIDSPDCIYVILEYCPEGDLFFNITERGHYVGKDSLVKKVFLQILDAVEHCHNLGIYHRDLKPENILVKDQGQTVKLADFGLATASERSEDYGCGSTFYMSPECLDHASRRPFYYSAPNDVWSLGVVLVNLACGRNPWKQASFEDSTYRAYARNSSFLKTILPISDELNDILVRIFTRNPEQRITLAELKHRIQRCAVLTEQAGAAEPCPSTEEAMEDEYEYDRPLSPSSDDSLSDDESTCSSDDGSSPSSIEDLDDYDDMPEAKTPPPTLGVNYPEPAIRGQDETRLMALSPEFVPQFSVPHDEYSSMAMPHFVQKFPQPGYPWDAYKFGHHRPQLHQPVPFHQAHMLSAMQGCY